MAGSNRKSAVSMKSENNGNRNGEKMTSAAMVKNGGHGRVMKIISSSGGEKYQWRQHQQRHGVCGARRAPRGGSWRHGLAWRNIEKQRWRSETNQRGGNGIRRRGFALSRAKWQSAYARENAGRKWRQIIMKAA
jgi:hypothetical protein